MHDKLKIVVSRTRGYDTIESREITIDFPSGIDEDMLRETFTQAEGGLLDLRDTMDREGVAMEKAMELRAPVETTLLEG